MSSQDEINEMLERWTAAEAAGDTETIDRYLTDDFVGAGPLGFLLPKQAWLGRHAPGGMVYESYQLEDVQVRVYGDAAIVVAVQTGEATYAGNPTPSTVRLTLTLVKPDGWRIAGAHMSFVAGTPGAPPMPAPGKPPASDGGADA